MITVLVAAAAVCGLLALGAGIYCFDVVLPLQPQRGPLPESTPEELELAERLRRHVTAVANTPHNMRYPRNLDAAARYIERALAGFGLNPLPQRFEVEGRVVRNIEAVLEPRGEAALAGDAGTYVIGAHYDSPDDSPGANDNGTGVAAVLELARLLNDGRPRAARIRLVLFVNEEQPWWGTENMGSWRYARRLAGSGERVRGMLALETLGYFSDRPGSQVYPAPLSFFFPDAGNFVAFVGLPGARRLVRKAVRAFRGSVAFPSIGGVAPEFIRGVGYSDHWAFKRFGFPAVMVTDTAAYRNPQYHRISDKPHTVDYRSLARVTKGLEHVARALSER
jgi:hypothetical protein